MWYSEQYHRHGSLYILLQTQNQLISVYQFIQRKIIIITGTNQETSESHCSLNLFYEQRRPNLNGRLELWVDVRDGVTRFRLHTREDATTALNWGQEMHQDELSVKLSLVEDIHYHVH